MGYYLLRNLRLDKRNNKIAAEVADSCWRDENDNHIYNKSEDIYPSIKTWEEKYAHLIYSVVTGGVRIQGSHKLRRIEYDKCIKELSHYYDDCLKLGDVNTYKKYKDVIENILTEKKDYIIKFSNSMAYLKSIGTKNYRFTFYIAEAKKFTKTDAENIRGIKDFKVVNYDDEVNRLKERGFEMFLYYMQKDEPEINANDLKELKDTYELNNAPMELYKSYSQLREKYPESKMLSEIVRVLGAIKNENIKTKYEEKIKETNILTKKEEKEYMQSKEELNKIKQEYDFDYIKEFEMVEDKFKEKYLNQELQQENFEESI